MSDPLPRFSIKVVSERTGISTHALRAWERRYGIPKPSRDAENCYRRYSEQDIADVLWLKHQIESGITPALAAALRREQRKRPTAAAEGGPRLGELRKRDPRVQVIMLTNFVDGALVQNALRSGAIGYLLKDVAIDELAAEIRLACQGRSTLSPAALQALAQTTPPEPEPVNILTERERQVLELLVQGMSNGEISNRLTINLSTPRCHVNSILSTLGVSNRAEGEAKAVKNHFAMTTSPVWLLAK